LQSQRDTAPGCSDGGEIRVWSSISTFEVGGGLRFGADVGFTAVEDRVDASTLIVADSLVTTSMRTPIA